MTSALLDAIPRSLGPASQEWAELLTRPWPEIRTILLKESDKGQRLRNSHPFKGIITEAERLAIIARHPAPGAHVDWSPPDSGSSGVMGRRAATTPGHQRKS